MIVPPGVGAAMAAAALELLRDHELAARLCRSARDVARGHAWSTVREQWREVYAGIPAGTPVGTLDPASLVRERRC
jgi:glycosyltransferase involved in cell wall biosynthesis